MSAFTHPHLPTPPPHSPSSLNPAGEQPQDRRLPAAGLPQRGQPQRSGQERVCSAGTAQVVEAAGTPCVMMIIPLTTHTHADRVCRLPGSHLPLMESSPRSLAHTSCSRLTSCFSSLPSQTRAGRQLLHPRGAALGRGGRPGPRAARPPAGATRGAAAGGRTGARAAHSEAGGPGARGGGAP